MTMFKFETSFFVILWVAFVVATVNASHIDPQLKPHINPFRKSTFFRKLADTINSHPKALWKAAVGRKLTRPFTNLSANFNQIQPQNGHPIFKGVGTKGVMNPPRNVQTATGVDWRLSGKLLSPAHQGSCGSCWVFASIHTMTDCMAIKSDDTTSQNQLSVQHVLECCKDYACAGCRGAVDNVAAFDYLTRSYTVGESCKMYLGSDYFCSRSCQSNGQWLDNVPQYSIVDYRRLSSNVDDIKQALNESPVLAAMEIYGDLYTYQYGLYEHFDNTFMGRHSVEMVGYGREYGRDYWIVKNSWGLNWGEEGYFRIVAGQNEAQIEEHVIIPILSQTERRNSSEQDPAISSPLGGSDDASVFSEDVMEAADYIAHVINPLCRDGKFDGDSEYRTVSFKVKRILKASRQIVEGLLYELLMELSLPPEICKVTMFVDATVHMSLSGEFGNYNARYVPPENIREGNLAVDERSSFVLVALMILGAHFVAKI